jgi:hypothetical protein
MVKIRRSVKTSVADMEIAIVNPGRQYFWIRAPDPQSRLVWVPHCIITAKKLPTDQIKVIAIIVQTTTLKTLPRKIER